jgi:transposase-like protein
MGHRDSIYWLSDIIELNDAFVGGKKPGKRGRGAEGKVSLLIACENREDKDGFIAMEVIDSVSRKNIEGFAKRRIKAQQTVRTDAYLSNNGLDTRVTHTAKITPPEKATEWLPCVHIAIANLKRFLLVTFHGTSETYLQENLNEFCYRFNCRFWESEIPNRLLKLCIDQRPLCGTCFSCRSI